MSAWSWPGTSIVKVIDADTIDAKVTRDLGFGGSVLFPIRLRLNRINAPKVSSKPGRLARDRVVGLVLDATVEVTTIKSYKYGGPDGQVGEYMAEVVLPDGRNLSDLLIEEGLAVGWTGQGARPADG